MKNYPPAFLAGLAVALLTLSGSSPAAVPPGGKQKDGKTVAKVREVDGALLSRAAPGTAWQPLKSGAAVAEGRLVVALPGAEIVSGNDAVRLKMLADVGKRGPFPVFESAVRIHDNPKVDLDFTLDRGIVGVVNLKPKGAATVRVRLDGKTFDLTLKEPGTTLGLEIFGRHPPCTPTIGMAQDGQVMCKDVPTLDLVLLVVKGSATLHSGGQDYHLQAPPGPAVLQWDNVSDQVVVKNLEKRPTPILPTGLAEEKYYKHICAVARRLAEEPIDKVMREFHSSKELLERRAVPMVAAALDDLPGVLAALADPTSAEVRDFTVTVLHAGLAATKARSSNCTRRCSRTRSTRLLRPKRWCICFMGRRNSRKRSRLPTRC